jgi:hypothetical protein
MTLRLKTGLALAVVSCCASLSAQDPSPATRPQESQPASQPDNTDERVVKPFPDITVRLKKDNDSVEIRAWTCLDSGFIEQVACSPQTREHESLVVVKAKPSQIHAALLMADFKVGSPGKWTYENSTIGTIPPRGEKLQIIVRSPDPAQPGRTIERPICDWLRSASDDPAKAKPFPNEPWVFSGSITAKNFAPMDSGEHYVADMSGSIIGLVTFGDEVIGFSKVISDQESVESPVWEVNTGSIPAPGTEVVLVIRKWPERTPEKSDH